MRHKVVPFGLVLVCLCGCSTVNFSGNYYDLPPQYRAEVQQVWQQIVSGWPLKHSYRYVILEDKDFKRSKGVPAIANDAIILPDKFLRYIYQNYYDYRSVILTSVITHELCHGEFGLPSSPAQEHFKTDQCAIQILGKGQVNATFYYKSLYVMRNYWFARKGMGGHAFNVGWNVANVAALALTGHGHFADWFATDLDERLRLISRNYQLMSTGCFPRSRGPG